MSSVCKVCIFSSLFHAFHTCEYLTVLEGPLNSIFIVLIFLAVEEV